MTFIDGGAWRHPGSAGQVGATHGSHASRASFQDRADALVQATVLSDLGQGVGGHGRQGNGIQGIAASIQKVLSTQDATGTDAADDVLKKIETSLHKAAQALADRGVDAKTIDKTIDRFRAQLANTLDGMSGGPPGSAGSSDGGSSSASGASGSSPASGSGATSGSSGSGATSGSGSSVSASSSNTTSATQFVSREVRKERGAIDLITAEGDRVSIRFRSTQVATASGAQATGADGTSASATKTSFFSRGGVKIEVDGDLNDDELKAINDLVGKVDDIATKFFSGDVQAAFSAASSIGVDSDQIAAYRLDVTYSQRAAAAYSAVATSNPVASGAIPGLSGTSARMPTPVTQTVSSANSAVATARALWTRVLTLSTLGGSVPASAPSIGAANGATTTDDASDTSPDAAASASDASAAASSDATAAPDSTDVAPTVGASDGTSTAPSTASTDAPSDAPLSDATDASATTDASSAPSNAPPAAPASAQKTLVDFINDALSKLGSANGAGRVSFSMHWKINALVTRLDSAQPAKPTTAADQTAAANTRLLNDSLQKITAA